MDFSNNKTTTPSQPSTQNLVEGVDPTPVVMDEKERLFQELEGILGPQLSQAYISASDNEEITDGIKKAIVSICRFVSTHCKNIASIEKDYVFDTYYYSADLEADVFGARFATDSPLDDCVFYIARPRSYRFKPYLLDKNKARTDGLKVTPSSVSKMPDKTPTEEIQEDTRPATNVSVEQVSEEQDALPTTSEQSQETTDFAESTETVSNNKESKQLPEETLEEVSKNVETEQTQEKTKTSSEATVQENPGDLSESKDDSKFDVEEFFENYKKQEMFETMKKFTLMSSKERAECLMRSSKDSYTFQNDELTVEDAYSLLSYEDMARVVKQYEFESIQVGDVVYDTNSKSLFVIVKKYIGKTILEMTGVCLEVKGEVCTFTEPSECVLTTQKVKI